MEGLYLVRAIAMIRHTLIRICVTGVIFGCFCGCATHSDRDDKLHQFKLVGGHFYGPGPIEPDTALPVGYLRNIHFDIKTFSGYAEFYNDGSEQAVLSDGKTLVNQNIDAGILDIGGGDNTVLLVAIKGGPNKGMERYELADDYAFEWRVDLALDPGFTEGIVAVDNFKLTTGLIQIADSHQTENGMPGGYDQAGSLKSGQYLAGRVGDYNQDGYLDGVVVAGPRVPLESNMLPGSPVGNKRGFETDIHVQPHIALELTLRSIAHFREPFRTLVSRGDRYELIVLLKDIAQRINAAKGNMDRSLILGPWSHSRLKKRGFKVSNELNQLKTLHKIVLSMIEHYPQYDKEMSDAVVDALDKMFSKVDGVIYAINKINHKTDMQLPKRKS